MAAVEAPTLKPTYETYEEASQAAQAYVNHFNVELGIEASYAYAGAPKGSAWAVWQLPHPQNRFGRDLRCEVVRPMRGRP